MTCKAALSRVEAETRTATAYERALGRNPFTANPYDAGAYDWVLALMYHGESSVSMEAALRESEGARARAVRVTRSVYRHILHRDPGPPTDGAQWADPGALNYAESFRLGTLTEDQLEQALMDSDEYRNGRRDEAGPPVVLDNVLHDTSTGRKELELSISLFYWGSPDVSDADFEAVVGELAAAGVRQVRLAGSTFTWDNPLRKANVIPFRAGTTYTHKEGVDAGKSVDPIFDPAHQALLHDRLEMLRTRGIRAQYTIFWGGMQAMFMRDGREVLWERVGGYVEDVARFFAAHPEHVLELVNEADHGHHLAKIGVEGRKDFFVRCSRIIRQYHPDAVITASDGGHQPAGEGEPYFAYHDVDELNYWNVHYPRDTIEVDGIPRWARGSWHLYEDRAAFRHAHGVGGYGRSDENIFLTTPAEHEKWGYRGSTRDWQMYGVMFWVTTMAGAALTLHTHKGFFCERGLTSDPIFDVVRGWNEITRGFPWHGATSYNAGWSGSPVKALVGPFKAFSLTSGENGRDVLVTVLNPRQGILTLQLDRPRLVNVYEITGELIESRQAPKGLSGYQLPKSSYGALVLRMNG